MNSHEVYIHPFLRPDHWDVADIWIASWDNTMPRLGHIARHDWVFHQLESLHDDGAVTICALNQRTGGIAGFATLDPAHRKLLRIAVASSARGEGVASALLDRAKKISPDGLSAEVPQDNARARRFFSREGFTFADGKADVAHWAQAASGIAQ